MGFDLPSRVVTELMCVVQVKPHDVCDTNVAEVSMSKGIEISKN